MNAVCVRLTSEYRPGRRTGFVGKAEIFPLGLKYQTKAVSWPHFRPVRAALASILPH